MGNRNYAIDVFVLLPIVKRELSNGGNLLCLMTRAHAGGHDQDKVACANATIFPFEAHKGRALIFGKVIWRWGMQRLGQIAHDRYIVGHIVMSDLLTGPNPERRTDWLTELQNKGSLRDIASGKAMAGLNGTAQLQQASVRQNDCQVCGRRRLNDSNIVFWIDNDRVVADQRRLW